MQIISSNGSIERNRLPVISTRKARGAFDGVSIVRYWFLGLGPFRRELKGQGLSLDRSALAGLAVLDVTQVLAGPFCTMMLADLGANVIKIEPLSGDSTRQWPRTVGADSTSFNAVNRGKRSVVLDLKTKNGREVFTRFARSTDILIENYRPGVMAAFGLDYPSLAMGNPRLIYASISAYGQTGPQRAKGGFDLITPGLCELCQLRENPVGRP